MTYKGLLRQSRPRQDRAAQIDRPAIQLPLTATSPAMQAFVEQCIYKAKMGKFVMATGHAGDLIEAPALFQHLLGVFTISRHIVAASGNERLDVLSAEDEEIEALFVPCANQIPNGTQEFMAEGHLGHLRLVLLCYPANKNIYLANLIRPALQEVGGKILQYPTWDAREEDHEKCIRAAMDIAEARYDYKPGFSDANVRDFSSIKWKSMAHMVAAVMETAEQRCLAEESTGNALIKL